MKKKLFTLIMMLISFSIQIIAQMRDYTAMVVDAETGEALHYASIYIAENRGTITNQDGKFLISASPEEILQIKFVGYENLRIKASEMRDVIRLKPATHTMQEVSVFPVMELLKNITTKLNGEYKKSCGKPSSSPSTIWTSSTPSPRCCTRKSQKPSRPPLPEWNEPSATPSR